MEKIIYLNLPFQNTPQKVSYTAIGNKTIQYDKEIHFPINALLANKLKNGDNVKIVILEKESEKTLENEILFKDELNEINKDIGANIEYRVIKTEFNESYQVESTLLYDSVKELSKDCEIYADISYGPKTLPFIIFYTIKFAQKVYNAQLKMVIYGKVDFKPNSSEVTNAQIFDETPFFSLDNILNVIDEQSPKNALEIFKLMIDA